MNTEVFDRRSDGRHDLKGGRVREKRMLIGDLSADDCDQVQQTTGLDCS